MDIESKKPDWEIRAELPNKVLHILDSNESEFNKIALLEDSIVFIEKGYFLRDIEYTSRGAMKDTTFFWEKSKLIELINVLPKTLKQRVLPVLFDKLELMLPKEKQSFESLSYAAKVNTIPHDRNVFENLKKIVKEDLIQTKKFLLNNLDSEVVTRLLKLIPDDEYFNLYEN